MAVEQDATLRDAIQALVDYSVTHGLEQAEDRAWSYNAVLECAGAQGPAPEVDWVLTEGAPAEDATFDLDATLAIIAEAAVAIALANLIRH